MQSRFRHKYFISSDEKWKLVSHAIFHKLWIIIWGPLDISNNSELLNLCCARILKSWRSWREFLMILATTFGSKLLAVDWFVSSLACPHIFSRFYRTSSPGFQKERQMFLLKISGQEVPPEAFAESRKTFCPEHYENQARTCRTIPKYRINYSLL